MLGPNYIHVRDSDDIVIGVFVESEATGGGETEYFESHPLWIPPWTTERWQRTGVNTYVLVGGSLEPSHGVDPEKDRFGISSDDSDAGYWEEKVIAGEALSSTTLTDSNGFETVNVKLNTSELTEDSSPDGAADFVIFFDATEGVHNKVKIDDLVTAGGGGGGGGDKFYDEHEPEATTTSQSYQTKLSSVFNITSAGDYILHWTTEIAQSDSDKRVDVRVRHGATVLNEVQETVKNEVQVGNEWVCISGFRSVNLTTGNNTFDIQYKRFTGGGTAKVRRTRLYLEQR